MSRIVVYGDFILMSAPVVGLVSYIVFHAVLSRIYRGGGQTACHVAGSCIGFCFAGTISYLCLFRQAGAPDLAGCLLLNSAAYLCLAWCYLHFVNLNLTSIRIRLMQEFLQSPQGLTEKEILSCYSADTVVDKRIERLVNSGHLVEKDEHLFVGKGTLLVLFSIFEFLKYLIMGRGNRLLVCEEPLNEFAVFLNLFRALWKNSFFRFLLVGGVNTIFSYLLYTIIILIGIDYRITVTICAIVTTLWNFNTTGRLVFRSRNNMRIFRFIAGAILLYLLNLGLLTILVGVCGMGKLIGQAVALPIVVITAFMLNKGWVFKSAG